MNIEVSGGERVTHYCCFALMVRYVVMCEWCMYDVSALGDITWYAYSYVVK